MTSHLIDAARTPAMKKHVSPRQLAEAIGVSESSVKRWSDRGLIPVERTAGGHRRLPVGGVLQFLRSGEMSLLQPELLGLPTTSGDEPFPDLVSALSEGDEERFRALVFRLYVDGWSAAEIGDRAVSRAFRELGESWQHGRLEVYEERRGVEVCQRVLFELRQAVPLAGDGAPRAVGGTLAGDWYSLPTTLVEIALREIGWRAQSLGSSHPAETLVAAIEEQRPRLFWLSVSWFESLARLEAAVASLYAAAAGQGTALVLGGRALSEDVRRRLRVSAFCDDLMQVQTLAAALVPTGARRDRGDEEQTNHVG